MSNHNHSSTLYSQSHILIEIDNLVQYLEQAYPDGQFYETMLYSLPRFLSVYSPRHKYSEHIQLLWDGCMAVGLLDPLRPVPLTMDVVDGLVSWIAQAVKQPYLKRFKSDRRYEMSSKNDNLSQYTQSLHIHYARLLVIRVDLYYRMECQHLVSVDDVYRHLEMMTTAKYGNPLFEHLVGSAWCIEQGETRGYHLHTAYYFKGSEHQNDWYMAQQIGQLWERVTQGLGTYHSCNTPAEKVKYDKLGVLGVGMIRRNDRMACENSVNTVGYLADYEKEDQYLRMKPKGRRVFGTGVVQKGRL